MADLDGDDEEFFKISSFQGVATSPTGAWEAWGAWAGQQQGGLDQNPMADMEPFQKMCPNRH